MQRRTVHRITRWTVGLLHRAQRIGVDGAVTRDADPEPGRARVAGLARLIALDDTP